MQAIRQLVCLLEEKKIKTINKHSNKTEIKSNKHKPYHAASFWSTYRNHYYCLWNCPVLPCEIFLYCVTMNFSVCHETISF